VVEVIPNSKYKPHASDLTSLSRYFDVNIGWRLGAEGVEAQPVASQSNQGQPKARLSPRRVEVRLLNEAAVRSFDQAASQAGRLLRGDLRQTVWGLNFSHKRYAT